MGVFTLPALQKHFEIFFFFVFAWGFGIEKGQGFLVHFLWSPFPGKQSAQNPQKFWGNSEENSGENSGRKFERFREISFCKSSGLRVFLSVDMGRKVTVTILEIRQDL